MWNEDGRYCSNMKHCCLFSNCNNYLPDSTTLPDSSPLLVLGLFLVWLFLAFCSPSALVSILFPKSLLSVHLIFLLPVAALHSFVGTILQAFVSSISSASLKPLLLFRASHDPLGQGAAWVWTQLPNPGFKDAHKSVLRW